MNVICSAYYYYLTFLLPHFTKLFIPIQFTGIICLRLEIGFEEDIKDYINNGVDPNPNKTTSKITPGVDVYVRNNLSKLELYFVSMKKFVIYEYRKVTSSRLIHTTNEPYQIE